MEKEYIKKLKEDCNKLNIKWPEIVVPATSMIDEYIDFRTLVKKNMELIPPANPSSPSVKLTALLPPTNTNRINNPYNHFISISIWRVAITNEVCPPLRIYI